MKIGINARYLQNRHTGIQNYLLNLILNLSEVDKKNEYLLFFGKDKAVPASILEKRLNFNISKFPTSNQFFKILWAHFYLPYVIKKERLDLFHESSFIAPLIKMCPTVITVYDLAFLFHPECFTYRNKLYLKSLLAKSIKKADLIITISESSKSDILENFSIRPEKIKVIYGAVDGGFHRIYDEKKLNFVKEKYNIKKDFILNVSLITPRKNLLRLIRAYKGLLDSKKIDCQLVIAGAKGWLCNDVFKEVNNLNLGEEVIFCDYLSKEDLLNLYSSAILFAYPSLYEGFGLPILEAMACGCPVLTSNISSMPEICDNAAFLVDPKNVDELVSAIGELTNNNSLRQDLIKKGLEQVKKFSWRKTAEQTLEAYNEVIF